MRRTKKKKKVTERFFLAQSLSRYCFKRQDGFLAEDFAGSPGDAHRDLSFHGLIPLALKAAGFVCSFTNVPESIGDLCLKHPVRSCILSGCFTLQALLILCGCFIGEKSECPRKQFTHYSLWDQRHEMLDLFEESLLSQSLQPTFERRF